MTINGKSLNFVADRIASGQYANAGEVLRAGLRALEEDEREEQVKLEALREAIKAGEESGVAEGDVFAPFSQATSEPHPVFHSPPIDTADSLN